MDLFYWRLLLAAAESQAGVLSAQSFLSLAKAHGLASNTINGTVTCEHCIERTVPALVNIITEEVSLFLLAEIFSINNNGEVVIPPFTIEQCMASITADCSTPIGCLVEGILGGYFCPIIVAYDVITILSFNLLIHGFVKDYFPPLETCIDLGYCTASSDWNLCWAWVLFRHYNQQLLTLDLCIIHSPLINTFFRIHTLL